MLTWIELFVVAGLLLLALVCSLARWHWAERGVVSVFDPVERAFSRLGQHRLLSIVIVAVVSLALRLAVLPLLPVPAPTVDDEFSYLLQADTFVHGRLTNPTPAMWRHFETFHTNMLPTYQSKYPPAQGAMLAAGTLIFSKPIVGVWLSMAAMCAALCWMLQEWIGPQWALAGGLLVAIRLSAFSYWDNSYWGGAVAATGGALMLGALARMKHASHVQDALLMGLGIAILANSRPYEGLLLCIPVAATLLYWWLHKKGTARNVILRDTAIPLALCLLLTGAGIGYYNWKLTGRLWLLPYQLHERTYVVSPLFIYQKPRPQPAYRPPAMRDFYLSFDLPHYQETQSARGLIASWYDRSKKFWRVLLGPLLTLPLLLAPLTMFRNWR